MVYAFFNGEVVDGFQGNIPESQVIEFVKKITELAGPDSDIKVQIENLEKFIIDSNWEKALGESNLILDIDQNNLDASYGKILSLIGLHKFDLARGFFHTAKKKS